MISGSIAVYAAYGSGSDARSAGSPAPAGMPGAGGWTRVGVTSPGAEYSSSRYTMPNGSIKSRSR